MIVDVLIQILMKKTDLVHAKRFNVILVINVHNMATAKFTLERLSVKNAEKIRDLKPITPGVH